MNWFLLLKTIHVFSAIIAVGSNATYAVWSARSQNEPAQLGFALRGIKFIDDRMANPAYGVLLITGLIMAFTTYSITTTWILIGLGLWLVLAVVGFGVYTPTLTKQIAALAARGAESPEYRGLDSRARVVGIFLGVVAIAVVIVMVVKPLV